MKHRGAGNESILSDKVYAIYNIKDSTLYNCDYRDVLPQGGILLSVPLCEVRDIKDGLSMQDKMIYIHLDFNLLFILEYMLGAVKEYGLFTDKIHRDICIEKKLHGLPDKNLKAKNAVEEIRYVADTDNENDPTQLHVTASIKCMLFEIGDELPDCIDIAPAPTLHEMSPQPDPIPRKVRDANETGTMKACNTNQASSPSVDPCCDSAKAGPREPGEPKITAYDIQNTYEKLRMDYYKLSNIAKEKDAMMSRLKSALRQGEQRNLTLQSTCEKMAKEIESLSQEMHQLKNLIEEEKSRPKPLLNSKIQSAIHNMRSFF